MAEFACCRIIPGRSLRPLDFPALRQVCGTVLDTPPEYHRRKPGVSGRPEYPTLVTGISGLLNRHRQKLRPGAESPPAPEFPVPEPESPALPRANCMWCGTGSSSGGTPEGDRSFRPAPESPAQVTSNGQKSWRGINTPPPTSG